MRRAPQWTNRVHESGFVLTPAQSRLMGEIEAGATLVQTDFRPGRGVQILLRRAGGMELEVRASLAKSLVRRNLLRMKRFVCADCEWGFEAVGVLAPVRA
jgi:hypothetical protein